MVSSGCVWRPACRQRHCSKVGGDRVHPAAATSESALMSMVLCSAHQSDPSPAICAAMLRLGHLWVPAVMPLSASVQLLGLQRLRPLRFRHSFLGDGPSIRRSSEYPRCLSFRPFFRRISSRMLRICLAHNLFFYRAVAWLQLHCRPVGRPLLSPLALSGLAGATRTMCVSAKGSGSAYLLFRLVVHSVVHLLARGPQLRSGRLHHAHSALSACHVFTRFKRNCT